MSLFEGYFDPEQFQAGGGLLGRLLSLPQMQGLYQPGADFDPQIGRQLPDPDDRLRNGFQSWDHVLAGNPIAALANGVAGINRGPRPDPARNPQPDRDPHALSQFSATTM